MAKPPGRLVTEIERERERAYHAEHALHRKVFALIAAVGAIVVAAGIVVAIATRPPSPRPPVPQPAPLTTNATPTITERGNIAKQVGELAGFGSDARPDENTFAITKITVDPPCAPGGTDPDSEHTVLLELTVTTGPDEERAAQLGRILTPGFFSVVDDGGGEHDAWPGECTSPETRLPAQFEPGDHYTGTVELRVAEATGVLVLVGHMENAAGWEWELPSPQSRDGNR